MKTTRILGTVAALFTATLLLTPVAKAQSTNPIPNLTYYVTLSNLNELPTVNGENFLDFQLNTGSGNVTNVVTLSNFSFTGGSADSSGGIYTNGNVTGSLGSSLILTSLVGQADPINEFDENFTTSVTAISFKVTATPNSETVNSGTPTPEQFNVDIQDGLGNYIPTSDSSGGNNLLTESIYSSNTVASVNTYQSVSPDAGVTVSAVPEPSTYALFGLGALLLMAVARRRSA